MLKLKWQREQKEKSEVSEMLLRQKGQINELPALLSAYPQRDLQKGALESSLSPEKKPSVPFKKDSGHKINNL